jgi:hypothetical protein
MIHRVGLFIASLAAAGTLVIALTLAGLVPGGRPDSGVVATATRVPETASAQADPQVQIDTIYLAAPEKPATITVHRVIPASTGGEGGEQGLEGSDD